MRSLRGRVGLCAVLWAATVFSPFPCAAADGDSLTPEKLGQAIRFHNDLPENLSFHATLKLEMYCFTGIGTPGKIEIE